MQGSSRRVSTRNTKLRMDEARGGIIKVMASAESHKNDSSAGLRRLRRNQSDSVAFERKKRSNCAPSDKEETGSIGTSPVKLRKTQSDLSNSPKTSVGNSLNIGGEEEAPTIGDGTEVAVVMEEEEEEEEEETETEEGMKSFVDKEMDQPDEKPKTVQAEEEEEEEIPALSQEEEKNQNLVSMSPVDIVEKKQNLVMDYRAMKPDPAATPHFDAEEEEMFQSTCIKNNRIQSIENLVMWRDVSRSAFVFGIGTFFLVSSSYAKDINFSLISASSYVGLVYLGFAFLCKSFVHRGETMQYYDGDERRAVVGEEDAIWLLKMLLPYINELLLKFRGLFSGDPATTLKLAALLFVMARCGSTITVWSLAKLMFFGVFTIPKVCSSYSTQLAKLGKFWLDRLRDGWESCTHKKAAAAAIFALIWNISSAVARIWAFFMLVVAVKLYQQCTAEYSWNGREEEEEEVVAEAEEEEEQEDSMAGQCQELGLHGQRGGPTRNEVERVDVKVDLGKEAGKRSK
ncbi:hypothetical protein OPV22_007831 [Ensete ventricosum]|uniref:Reticulon-like protein n=1 Tax=Ensete ventricosum TaxID=4639 RepID=A0AAV8RDB7_ENSVE|nr:hypothetical protein OPV22_007831 [Ensete ventricosum]